MVFILSVIMSLTPRRLLTEALIFVTIPASVNSLTLDLTAALSVTSMLDRSTPIFNVARWVAGVTLTTSEEISALITTTADSWPAMSVGDPVASL